MIPFADMINHRNPKQNMFYFDEERKGFVMKALMNIPKGAEVTISYNDITAKCIISHGFLSADGTSDVIEMDFELALSPKQPCY